MKFATHYEFTDTPDRFVEWEFDHPTTASMFALSAIKEVPTLKRVTVTDEQGNRVQQLTKPEQE